MYWHSQQQTATELLDDGELDDPELDDPELEDPELDDKELELDSDLELEDFELDELELEDLQQHLPIAPINTPRQQSTSRQPALTTLSRFAELRLWNHSMLRRS